MHTHRSTFQTARRALAAVLVAAPLVLVGGCGLLLERPSPSTTTTLEPASSRAPSEAEGALPPPAEPVRPERWADDGPEGAVAAAQHYLAVRNYAYFTGDPIPVWDLSTRECGLCTSAIEEIYKLRGMGQYAIFGEPTSRSEPEVEAHESLENAWLVELDEVAGAVQRFNKYGEIIAAQRAGASRTTWVTVAHADGEWLVHETDAMEIS